MIQLQANISRDLTNPDEDNRKIDFRWTKQDETVQFEKWHEIKESDTTSIILIR